MCSLNTGLIISLSIQKKIHFISEFSQIVINAPSVKANDLKCLISKLSLLSTLVLPSSYWVQYYRDSNAFGGMNYFGKLSNVLLY